MRSTATKKGPDRSGATALSLLAAPLNLELLRGLQEQPLPLIDLRRRIGSPPQSTVRIYLRTLEELGVVGCSRAAELQGATTYALTEAGQALAAPTKALEDWLQLAPQGPLELGTPAAKSAIGALVEGWSSNIVRALAAQTLSLTELARRIPRISYPGIERRLTAMRLVGLIEPHKEDGRSTPFRPTEWLRRAVVPLIAASEWEREKVPELTPPIGRLEVEAAFLLAMPLTELPPGLSGKVRLAVEVKRGASPVFAGVVVGVEGGEVASCTPGLEGEAAAWVSGAPRSWLRRMNLGEEDHLELGGDAQLARGVLEGLERAAAGR